MHGMIRVTKKDANKLVNFIQVSFKQLRINGLSFSTDAGIPTIGFRGAKFDIITNGAPASEFNWQSSASWVSVENGKNNF